MSEHSTRGALNLHSYRHVLSTTAVSGITDTRVIAVSGVSITRAITMCCQAFSAWCNVRARELKY
jgi:hypothetical protein